jgi:hypothetical protein
MLTAKFSVKYQVGDMEILIDPDLFMGWLNTALDREPIENMMSGGQNHTVLDLDR